MSNKEVNRDSANNHCVDLSWSEGIHSRGRFLLLTPDKQGGKERRQEIA
jgi:hypothetical protein